MTDKTQIEKDVTQMRGRVNPAIQRGDAPITYILDLMRLYDLLSSPAFAAQFEVLLEEYAKARSLSDYNEEEGGYSQETMPDWDAVNAARARLREFVVGEGK